MNQQDLTATHFVTSRLVTFVLAVTGFFFLFQPDWLGWSWMVEKLGGTTPLFGAGLGFALFTLAALSFEKNQMRVQMAELMVAGDFDPTVINGGIIHAYGSNARMGQGEWMVVEADESDGSFNRLPATIAIVTNIDPEHMEHWGDFDKLRDGFYEFVSNLPFYGLAVCCTDHAEVQTLVGRITDRRVRTYGFNAQADVRAVNLTYKGGVAHFDVTARA